MTIDTNDDAAVFNAAADYITEYGWWAGSGRGFFAIDGVKLAATATPSFRGGCAYTAMNKILRESGAFRTDDDLVKRITELCSVFVTALNIDRQRGGAEEAVFEFNDNAVHPRNVVAALRLAAERA